MFRLTWLHAQTSRDRWKEEHILLRSEAERITLSFRHAATRWRALNPPSYLDSRTQRGILAYGQKKGSMFDELAKEANVHLAIIDKHWKVALEKGRTDVPAGTVETIGLGPVTLEDTDEFY